jgi:uncharacterized surface protein with fasciclin (FAS1) repeats
MKTKTMKNGTSILSSFLLTFLLMTCNDNVGDNLTTFEDETVTSFLEKDPGNFSEFTKIMKASGISDLLSAYGAYTCFAPTNEAFQKYYAEKETSFEQLPAADISEIACSHILGKMIESVDFPIGMIAEINLNGQFLSISYSNDQISYAIYVNEKSRILSMDQKVHNGVIHTLDKVLIPSKVQLPEVIDADPRFTLFSAAIYATNLSDSMRLLKDFDYEQTSMITALYHNKWVTPPTCYHGYTAFLVSDSTLATLSVFNMDDLKNYAASVYDKMYPEDKNISDITNRRNSLNRFIAYHLLDRQLASNEFLPKELMDYYIPNTTAYSYIEPMCPNTLIEVRTGDLFNKRKDGTAIQIISPNHTSQNGIYHEINRPLLYDEGIENDVLNKRIRFDVIDMLPELATNKIRGNNTMYLIPQGYMKYLKYTESTETYYKISRGYQNHRGDEIILGGKYDFTLRMPAIPAGTYEVRFGYTANGGRGVAQIYFDDQPCGIPLDMRIQADAPKIGWVRDNTTDDDGIENDKMMRNRGYYKGPNNILVSNNSILQRDLRDCLRKVLLTRTFDKTEPHTLRVKSVEERNDREFQVDYMEFVPISYLEKEGKD